MALHSTRFKAATMRYEDDQLRTLAGRNYIMQQRASLLRPRKLPIFPADRAIERAKWRNNDVRSRLSDTSTDSGSLTNRTIIKIEDNRMTRKNPKRKKKTVVERLEYSPQLGVSLPAIQTDDAITKRRLQTCTAILDFCRDNKNVVKDDTYALLSQIQTVLKAQEVDDEPLSKPSKVCGLPALVGPKNPTPKRKRKLLQGQCIRSHRLDLRYKEKFKAEAVNSDSDEEIVEGEHSFRTTITVRLPKMERTPSDSGRSKSEKTDTPERVFTPLPPISK